MKVIQKNILRIIHNHASYHKDILISEGSGHCFYCLKSFKTNEVTEWIDRGLTALCPHCGIDSVLPLCSIDILKKYDLDLKDMNELWFSTEDKKNQKI